MASEHFGDGQPSLRSFARAGPIEKRYLQSFDFEQAPPRNPLQVAVQPRRRFDDAANLRFALCHSRIIVLRSRSRSACIVAEAFDNGLDPMPEAWAGEVLVDQLHLGLLPFPRLARRGHFDEGVAKGDGDRNGAAETSDPNAVDVVEGVDVLGQDLRNDQGDFRRAPPFRHDGR